MMIVYSLNSIVSEQNSINKIRFQTIFLYCEKKLLKLIFYEIKNAGK